MDQFAALLNQAVTAAILAMSPAHAEHAPPPPPPPLPVEASAISTASWKDEVPDVTIYCFSSGGGFLETTLGSLNISEVPDRCTTERPTLEVIQSSQESAAVLECTFEDGTVGQMGAYMIDRLSPAELVGCVLVEG